MATGVEMHDLYYRSLVRRTFPAARYWGSGLASLQKADGIIWATLTLEARRDSGYTGNDDADLINIVSSIEDCDVTMMFVEQKNGAVKVSWRASRPQVDVSQIAQQFGGGGHKAAAGAEVNGPLAEVQERILETTRRVLSHQIGKM
jgi:phosphoesterase RecJ-like protein